MIVVPDAVRGLPLIASVSGGKDSTALMLALVDASIPFRAVFADTGWEAPETYAYLDVLRARIGPIDVVGVPGGMVAKIRANGRFAGRTQRWCTRELKIEPLHAYHASVAGHVDDDGRAHLDTVSVIGVRRDESDARTAWPEIADDNEWGGWIWAPLVDWTVADVIAIHHRFDLPINPLYLRGHDRVGCYPCINATKSDIELIADHAPDRITTIRALEEEVSALRVLRNAEHEPTAKRPVRYAHEAASFFQGRTDSPLGVAPKIDDVVRWSRTAHGGRQLKLLADPPRSGCFRWCICEPPAKEKP